MFIIRGEVKTPDRTLRFDSKRLGVMETWNYILELMETIEKRANSYIEWNAECGLETQEILGNGEEIHFFNELRPEVDFIKVKQL